MTTIVEQLSSYAAGLRYEDLPREVVHQAKRLIVDTLGCALGGFESEPSRIARDVAGMVTSTRPATVLVSGQRTSPELAAFANGVMIRFLDFNDGYTSTGESGHPSDSIAAVLAAAELTQRSGKEVIAATVLAYEVFCRVCDQADLKPLGFDHVTVGGMASTAAAARLLGLREKQMAEAFNLGIAPNIALYQTRIGNVSMWKGCAYANASRNAVFAAMLAARGMTGPSPIFEGVGGYFKAVTGAPFKLAALGGREHPFKIMECSIKRYPLGLYSQTVVQAALEAREKIRGADEIAEVRIQTVGTAVRLMAGDPEKWAPATRETADHSMPYTVAVALIHGGVEEHHFDDEHLRDPAIRALTKRVKVQASQEADRRMPEAMLCELTLATKSGATHTAVVDHHKGHWKNPMSDSEVEAKFRALAATVLSPAQTDRLLKRLWKLEELADGGDILRLTVQREPPRRQGRQGKTKQELNRQDAKTPRKSR
ncbi:MAG: MmgE/PrpD family protein [Betaproteobacteria bacterium]|nr:MmgE/PrpD family protein [Betaproteobacteria bacterium]